ncbi:MAG: two-component system response regulator, partial [Pseudomonadota bacterium]
MSENIQTDTINSQDQSLLIVDDDRPFLQRLARAMESRGFKVTTAESITEGITNVKANPPA